MKLLIHFLLISCLSIIIAETQDLPSKNEIEIIIERGQFNITGCAPRINLKLLRDGEVYRYDEVLLWKGTFNGNTEVAIKIFSSRDKFRYEKKNYERLNATKDSTIEKNGVARVYYCGEIFGDYFAIARTWCDETLEDRFNRQNRNFSEPTILLIFKQTVQALRYTHSKYVIVWDVGLGNFFIRDQDIFIGELNQATAPEPRLILRDYESLLFNTIWEIAGVPYNVNNRLDPDYTAILSYFKDPDVREAFQFIVKIKNIRGAFSQEPNYDEIIKKADETLNKISEESRQQVQFDWLQEGSSGASSSQQRACFIL